MGKASPRTSPPQRVRIVAGIWRGRYIQVPPVESVRPTPARVRETLFNWLAGEVQGADCLDLFAGSGILGFEAASRGARHVSLVEHNRTIVRGLESEIKTLSAQDMDVFCTDALTYLSQRKTPVDIVFLDPPFGASADLLETVCASLHRNAWLKPTSRIYVETPAGRSVPVPSSWVLVKSKCAGKVGYHLFSASEDSRAAAGNGT